MKILTLILFFGIFLSLISVFIISVDIFEPTLTYAMPSSIEAFTNETKKFTIKISNPSEIIIHNLTINVLGIPSDSYKINPYIVYSLEPKYSDIFSVTIYASKIKPGSHPLTVIITSDEISYFPELTLIVKEAQIEPNLNFLILLGIIAILVSSTWIVIYFLPSIKGKRCPVCHARLKIEYKYGYKVYYSCPKCTYEEVSDEV